MKKGRIGSENKICIEENVLFERKKKKPTKPTCRRIILAVTMTAAICLVAHCLTAENASHVLYRVTPIFEGRNLVASGVLIEAWSVEDSGAGIRLCVYCYNVQPRIEIDYRTGESRTADSTAIKKKEKAGSA